MRIGDAVGSELRIELRPDGSFVGQQQGMGLQLQAVGRWAWQPLNGLLQLQGLVGGYQPFGLGILVHGFQDGAFFGTGSDGCGYWLRRA